MKTIKVKHWNEIPINYTGITEWENGARIWFKNGCRHREDGPAYIGLSGYKEWWLDSTIIWASNLDKLDLRNKIILSKEPHLEYPACQLFKYVDKNGIKERIIVPGMEEFIIK